MTAEANNKYQFDVEVNKILDLMINSLYTDKEVAIRELISNAADACDKARYLSLTDGDILEGDANFKISLFGDKENKVLTISDNGIGMNKADLISNLGTIAKSGTEGFLKKAQKMQKEGSNEVPKEQLTDLIGQFGVGFYSAFMIAKEVEVISRKLGEKKVHSWKSSGNGNFTVDEVKDSDLKRGTVIKLYLKDGEEEFVDFFRLQHIVKTYSNHLPFPIEFSKKDMAEPKQLNEGVALWTKAKSEIKPEDYEAFYKNISHLPGKPFITMHNKIEGVANFTSLLFVPDSRPFDLFHPDRLTRVKLYVRKVFITEENADLVPRFLRFVQGIVDSQDLPLNISRETLQYNSVLDKVRHSLTKKILGEFKKKSESDPEEYLQFWQNFGCVIKEGLCEQTAYKDDILETARFYTTLSPTKPITLEEYLLRVKDNQDSIYYLTGENLEEILTSPQLEAFQAKGVEVLLLTDTVDDFWVTVVNEYKGKTFKSITRTDIDLDADSEAVKAEKEAKAKEEAELHEVDDEAKKPEEKPLEGETVNPALEAFLKFAKEVLAEKVKEIKVSKKLTNSPVCLTVDANAMDIRLERYLVEQKQLAHTTAKILEINAQHPIILSLSEDVQRQQNLLEVEKYVKTLFDEACVLNGEKITNAKDFVERINELATYKMSHAATVEVME